MVTRAWRWVAWFAQRLACQILGHDLVMHFEPHWLTLRCTSCGYTTPGWSIAEQPRAGVVVKFSAQHQRAARDRAA